jgi:hypothetical protein
VRIAVCKRTGLAASSTAAAPTRSEQLRDHTQLGQGQGQNTTYTCSFEIKQLIHAAGAGPCALPNSDPIPWGAGAGCSVLVGPLPVFVFASAIKLYHVSCAIKRAHATYNSATRLGRPLDP